MATALTQKEMVVRYLAQRRGVWIPGHELVEHTSSVIDKTYIIQDADTRAHELARVGKYESPNNTYYIEHRKRGKFAEFRVAFVVPKEKKPEWVQGVGYLQAV